MMQRFGQHIDKNDKQIYDVPKVPKVLYFHKRGKMGSQFRHFLGSICHHAVTGIRGSSFPHLGREGI
jgi:hypothetical protein